MKKLLFLICTLLSININAQVEKKFRVNLSAGYISAEKTDFGLNFTLEPKYNIKKNMNIGIRLESAAAFRYLLTNNKTISGVSYANGSFMGTFDYYFDKANTNFVPFVGAGIGTCSFENKFVTDITDKKQAEPIELKSGAIFLIRSGFEWGKFRFGIDYNFLPSSNVLIRNNLVDLLAADPSDAGFKRGESFSNSYLAINVGFFLGGGKWGVK